MQTLRLQPPGEGCKIGIGEPEALAYLGGSEPVMIAGRSGILLVGQKGLKGQLLPGRSRQHQGQVLQG